MLQGLWLLVSLGCYSREDEQARLHSLTKSGRVDTLLVALAAHLRRQLIEFVVEAVAVRG